MKVEEKYAELVNYIAINNEYDIKYFSIKQLSIIFGMTVQGIKTRLRAISKRGYVKYRKSSYGHITVTQKGLDFLAEPFKDDDWFYPVED